MSDNETVVHGAILLIVRFSKSNLFTFFGNLKLRYENEFFANKLKCYDTRSFDYSSDLFIYEE